MPRGVQGEHHLFTLAEVERRLARVERRLAHLPLEDLATLTQTLLPEAYGEPPRRRGEPRPTAAFPGSAQKLETLRERAERGQQLHCRADEDGVRTDDAGLRARPCANGAPGNCAHQTEVARLRPGAARAKRPYRKITAVNSGTLGGRLRELRERLGWSRKRLARRTGVTVGALWFWEAGRSLPSLPVLVRLADALGVRTLDELVGRRAGA
jgi:DNA-binding XRE family transcriptional regulator